MARRRCFLRRAVGGLGFIAVGTCANAAEAHHRAASNAAPLQIPFAHGESIGPEGPWNFIRQSVGFPQFNVSLQPSVSRSSLIVSSSACQNAGAECPNPGAGSWTLAGNTGYRDSGGPEKASGLIQPSTWDPDYSALLDMHDSGQYIVERFTFKQAIVGNEYLDGQGLVLSDNFTVGIRGGTEYTLDTGFLSLYGGSDTLNWHNTSGAPISANITLPRAYSSSFLPSISYGLHLGAVNPRIDGSLVLGGYDSSRCLTTPITSKTETFPLVDISLNVWQGASALKNNSPVHVDGLLHANGSRLNELQVAPRPGVPYLYLPRQTCDAIANYLPVTYEPIKNLYVWNTEDDTYADIVTSTTRLVFHFNNGTALTNISVPFSLLNLTLDAPIAASPTKYFPCSPWHETEGTVFTLGNAFLQSAFLAQNWQSNTLFLAQAPGPNFQPGDVKAINPGDERLTPLIGAPTWESTWSGILQPLFSSASTSLPPGANNTATPIVNSDKGLSVGALAGIVVGVVVAGLALIGLAFWLWRRGRTRQATKSSTASSSVIEMSGAIDSPATPVSSQHYSHHDSNFSPDERGTIRIDDAGGTAQVNAAQISELHWNSPPVELPVGYEAKI